MCFREFLSMTKQQAEAAAELLRKAAYPNAVASAGHGDSWEVRAAGIIAHRIDELIDQIREDFEGDPNIERVCSELESRSDFTT